MAVLVIVAALLLYYGYNFIKGSNVFSSENTYYIKYDNVNGLIPGNQVMLNGLKVGMVQDCEFIQDGSNQILVSINVNGDIKIPKAVVAKIEAADLLGDMEINLDYSQVTASDFQNNLAQSGEELNGTLVLSMMESMSSEVAPITDKVNSLMGSADSLVQVLNQIIAGGQIENILQTTDQMTKVLHKTSTSVNNLMASQSKSLKGIIGNTERLTQSLTTSTQQLDGILQNATTFSSDLTDFSGELKKSDIGGMSSKLEATIDNANQSLSNLNATLAQVNNGDGTVTQLLKDRKLYDNMEKTLYDLDQLFLDLKENPKRYVSFSLIERKDKSKKKDKKEKKEKN